MKTYYVNEKQPFTVYRLHKVKATNKREAIKKAKQQFIIDWFRCFGLLDASREVLKYTFSIYKP